MDLVVIYIKSKKLIIILLVVIVMIILVLFGKLIVYVYLPKPTIIQSMPSPDGTHVAYVYESDGGATTGFIYNLSILQNGAILSKGQGNSYSSGYAFNIEWINNNELQVNNTSSIRIYKQKEVVKGIKINYKYLKQ